MNDFEKKVLGFSSVQLPDGGDTHFHLHGPGAEFTVTTRLPSIEGQPMVFREPFNEMTPKYQRPDELW